MCQIYNIKVRIMSSNKTLDEQFNDAVKAMFNTFLKFSSCTTGAKTHIDVFYQEFILKGIKIEPRSILMKLGPQLIANREVISSGNFEPFLQKRYEMDVLEASRREKFDYQNVINMINFSKQTFQGAKLAERENITKQLQALMTLAIQCKLAKLF